MKLPAAPPLTATVEVPLLTVSGEFAGPPGAACADGSSPAAVATEVARIAEAVNDFRTEDESMDGLLGSGTCGGVLRF
jgi:hypothetical protein